MFSAILSPLGQVCVKTCGSAAAWASGEKESTAMDQQQARTAVAFAFTFIVGSYSVRPEGVGVIDRRQQQAGWFIASTGLGMMPNTSRNRRRRRLSAPGYPPSRLAACLCHTPNGIANIVGNDERAALILGQPDRRAIQLLFVAGREAGDDRLWRTNGFAVLERDIRHRVTAQR